ncbi:MAG: NAD-dependent epimerase/dehydratase family protein [Zoogloea sp.]|uniref:NAD-dependent epimerase/dehydratase family protein n=1 Tax=Zoogloea sp. TaxID=49181 RepID=UPI003F36F8FB
MNNNFSNRIQDQLLGTFRGKSVLVTGAFGFIGSHVAARLHALGADVSVLDVDAAPTRPSLLNEQGLRSLLRVHEGSVSDFPLVRKIFSERRFDYVFNLAAHASTVEKAIEDPLETFAVNSLSVVAMLEAMRLAGNVPTMFFHASTDKVYGELNDAAYLEDDPLFAEGLYDTAKMAADAFARSFHRVFKIPTVVLRMCNIFGPYDMNIQSRLLPKSLAALFAADTPEAPTLYTGSQGHSRDYLYIDDLVNCVLLLTATPACQGEAYNAISCAHQTTPEMMQALWSAAQAEAVHFDPVRAELIRKNGIRRVAAQNSEQVLTITRQHLNSDKLQAAIAYQPQVTLEDGLRRTAHFYRAYFEGQRQSGPAAQVASA